MSSYSIYGRLNMKDLAWGEIRGDVLCMKKSWKSTETGYLD